MFVLHPYRMAFTFTNTIYLSHLLLLNLQIYVRACVFVRYVRMRILFGILLVPLFLWSIHISILLTVRHTHISKESNLLILTENRKKLKSHKRDTQTHTRIYTNICIIIIITDILSSSSKNVNESTKMAKFDRHQVCERT